ncbi:hypothetical protein LCGC14_1710660 [marine sediment metagenome]|uniref:Uncharacterized protein n=1 Tax=marine sediment metagenome TaxID=412755 RepID=A0A0F9JVQ4_9ZZZZ
MLSLKPRFVVAAIAIWLVSGSLAASAGFIPGFPIVLIGLLGFVLGAIGVGVLAAKMDPWR